MTQNAEKIEQLCKRLHPVLPLDSHCMCDINKNIKVIHFLSVQNRDTLYNFYLFVCLFCEVMAKFYYGWNMRNEFKESLILNMLRYRKVSSFARQLRIV
jgi:hypothetical protein